MVIFKQMLEGKEGMECLKDEHTDTAHSQCKGPKKEYAWCGQRTVRNPVRLE
jgi:hypothetical protein